MRVFVLCPPNCTGLDREALQQLVQRGRALGFDVTLARVWESGHGVDEVEPLHAPVDAPDSVVVVSDLEIARLLEFRLARKVIWWCNVDRFTRTNEGLRRALGRAQGPLDFAFDERFGCVHWARSQHAQQFLKRRGVASNLVAAYIEPETLAQAQQLHANQRSNWVVVADHAGTELVRQVMARVPAEVRWALVSQLSLAETPGTLARAKAYVDFGPHPDFEPLLCTAVAAGCVGIVGTQGQAGNDTDLPIPEAYKFDERDPNAADAIAGQLCRVLSDFATHTARFAAFRNWLSAGDGQFSEQVFQSLASLEATERRAQRIAV